MSYKIIKTMNDLIDIGLDIRTVDEESPFFAEANIYDISQEDPDRPDSTGYSACTVAIVGADGPFLVLDVLKESIPMREITVCLPVEKYARLTVPLGFVALDPLPSDDKLRGAYRTMQRMRRGSEFVIHARLYEGTGSAMGAAVVPGSEETWVLRGAEVHAGETARPVSSARQAMQWLVENHPDYYMGAVIESLVGGVKGLTIDPPGRVKYPTGYYENAPNRRRHIREKVIGDKPVKMGAKEYLRRWSELHGGMNEPDDDDDFL